MGVVQQHILLDAKCDALSVNRVETAESITQRNNPSWHHRQSLEMPPDVRWKAEMPDATDGLGVANGVVDGRRAQTLNMVQKYPPFIRMQAAAAVPIRRDRHMAPSLDRNQAAPAAALAGIAQCQSELPIPGHSVASVDHDRVVYEVNPDHGLVGQRSARCP